VPARDGLDLADLADDLKVHVRSLRRCSPAWVVR
jgi:hypothetical protein